MGVSTTMLVPSFKSSLELCLGTAEKHRHAWSLSVCACYSFSFADGFTVWIWQTSWNHVCALQYMTTGRLNEDRMALVEDGSSFRMFWRECGLGHFMVFILWYLLLRQTWHSGLPPGKVALLFLEHLCGRTTISDGQNCWDPREGKELPGLDPGVRGGQKAISNDKQRMIKEEIRYIQWFKLELNLVVGGISGKTCQKLFTQLDWSPHLAFTRNWDILRAPEEHTWDSVANKSTA